MLARINPTAKLVANLIALTALVLVSDPLTPLMMLSAALVAGWLGGALRPRHLTLMLPFALLAFGMFWVNAVWARVPGAVPFGHLGPFLFTDKGLLLGAALGLRVLAIAAFSVTFTAATDPTDLMLSLVQQLRLNPRYAYSVLAALRFLPTLESEFQIIRAAHRIRGAGSERWWAGPRRWHRYAIPLLAGGIRRAERVAIAMEARGFCPRATRTYYRTLRWRLRDTIFVLATAGVVAAILGISAALGWLNGLSRWHGF